MRIVILLLGLLSIILAYFPSYSKMPPLIGVIIGVIGMVLATKFIISSNSKHKGYLKFGKVVCIFGTTVSALMLMYNSIH